VVIGLAAVAPAYRSLAATLAFVVLAVGEKAPSMFLLAFIPMLLLAFAYKELSQDTPDCGTTFTWDTKAFGPWIGWIGGWGLAVSAIIVLANVAEIAAGYLFKFLNLPTRWPRSAWPSRSTTASPPMRACAISGAACSPRRETCSCAGSSRFWARSQ
jgi:amino acid transporter